MPDPEPVNPKATSALTSRKEVTLEKILVPIDFSDYTSAAVDYAVRIGKLAGTHIALLYVVEIPRHQLSLEVYSASERIRQPSMTCGLERRIAWSLSVRRSGRPE